MVAAHTAEAFWQLVGSGEAEVADLVHGLDARRLRRALGDDQGADGLDVAVSGLARTLGSRSDVPVRRRAWRFGPSTSTTHTSPARRDRAKLAP
jgi:hypothetical protein